MRKMMRACRAFLLIACAAACAVVLYAALHAPVFAQASAYTFYLGANSSSLAVQTDTPALTKLLLGNTAGESARYGGDRYEELKKKFCAELLFSETACGITNYYLYSPALGGGVMLGGVCVNLHIAVSETYTAAGTPLIFGGF